MAWTTTTTRASGFTVTAAVWNSEHVDNMNFLKRVDYATFTSTVNVTSTNSAAQDTIVAGTSLSYEAVPHHFYFFCPSVNGINGVRSFLTLYDGTTAIGRIGDEARATGALTYQVALDFWYIPTAATHQFIIKGYNNSAGTCAYQAGAGGAATTAMPGSLAIFRTPT